MLRRTISPAELTRLSSVIRPQCAWISEAISQTLSSEQPHASSGTCLSRPPISCRSFLTSPAAPASGMGGTGSSTVDIFDRCALPGPADRALLAIALAARGRVTRLLDAEPSLPCRDVKRAHRERAVRLQTSEDPLQVSPTTSCHDTLPHADYLYNAPPSAGLATEAACDSLGNNFHCRQKWLRGCWTAWRTARGRSHEWQSWAARAKPLCLGCAGEGRASRALSSWTRHLPCWRGAESG